MTFCGIREIPQEPPARRVRHKKTGGTYEVICAAKMQSTHWHDHHYGVPADMRSVIIYRSEKDGSIWVRPEAEFEDGRFEEVTGEAR